MYDKGDVVYYDEMGEDYGRRGVVVAVIAGYGILVDFGGDERICNYGQLRRHGQRGKSS